MLATKLMFSSDSESEEPKKKKMEFSSDCSSSEEPKKKKMEFSSDCSSSGKLEIPGIQLQQ